jgi:serine protease Do
LLPAPFDARFRQKGVIMSRKVGKWKELFESWSKRKLFVFLLLILVPTVATTLLGGILLGGALLHINYTPASAAEANFSIDDQIGTPLTDQFGYAPVVQTISPSVVYILGETAWGQQAGTGVIVTSNGGILTNYHVVEGANHIEVTLSDGDTYDATKVSTDPSTDLAVVWIDTSNLTAAHLLRNSLEQMQVGDMVIAVGNALALSGGFTATDGIVSNLDRYVDEGNGVRIYDIIQTSAAINPGNSGGPLVDLAGQVVGINTAIVQGAENIGFAISTDIVIPVVEQLVQNGTVSHPWLGVYIETVTPGLVAQYGLSVTEGAFIDRVVAGSPADNAALKAGDVIVEFDGQKIATADDLIKTEQSHQVGDEIQIDFVRGTTTMTATLHLGSRPSS